MKAHLECAQLCCVRQKSTKPMCVWVTVNNNHKMYLAPAHFTIYFYFEVFQLKEVQVSKHVYGPDGATDSCASFCFYYDSPGIYDTIWPYIYA